MGVLYLMKKVVVSLFTVIALLGAIGVADGAAFAEELEHTELTFDSLDLVRDYYTEYASENSWESLGEIMRAQAEAEVISDGAFVASMSRLYTPRVLWVERMAIADYYFRSFDEAEEEYYTDYYVDPADGAAILVILRDSNPKNLEEENLEFIIRDSTGKVYRDEEIKVDATPAEEQTFLGMTWYDAVYRLYVQGDLREVEYLELFILVDTLVARAHHKWELH